MSDTMTPCESHVQSPLLTIFDILICLLVAASYIPQLSRIAVDRQTTGISPWYIVLVTISSSTHLAARLVNGYGQLAVDCVRGGQLSGWKAFSALVIYLQLAVQWICAVVLLVLYVRFRDGNQDGDSPEDAPATQTDTGDSYVSAQDQEPCDAVPHAAMSNKAILATVITHAVIILPVAFTLFILGRPDDDQEGFGSEMGYAFAQQILHATFALSGLATSLSSAVPAVHLIVARSRSGYGLGSLSVVGLGLQFLAFVALGVSQGVRLGWPRVGDASDPPLSVYAWFLLVNGPAVGFVALGVGQLVVMGVALRFGAAEGQVQL
ncbi:hypothetical protein FQN54_004660 [Arachnomyces sp. PD_36]|nr:hypothetical protein FQN54_004660 [Arachnomyces sp. PD_36]